MLEKLSNWTHMPFLTQDKEGNSILLYSSAEESESPVWKLFALVGDEEPFRIETGIGDDITECSPTAWQDETGWHLSFIANGSDETYRLYRMDGETLQSLSQPVAVRIARSGFLYQERIVVGEIQDVIHVHDTSGDHKIVLPGAFIYRVAYRADNPEKLLMSGDWIGEKADVFTLEYDLTDDSQRYLECNGEPAYKCTIYGEKVLFAHRESGGFEDRKIVETNNLSGIPSQIAARYDDTLSAPGLVISKRCGCRLSVSERKEKPVRPSCLECVEKHLGAAAVLLSEIQNGYAYRIYFVGHLNEAEEESQEWPELHEAIRQARKDYLHFEIVPDWEELGQKIAELRVS